MSFHTPHLRTGYGWGRQARGQGFTVNISIWCSEHGSASPGSLGTPGMSQCQLKLLPLGIPHCRTIRIYISNVPYKLLITAYANM
jgi:hypothetical protein